MSSTSPLSIASLFSVKGWVAVVTGGGTGIGLMITQALATNGAKVYITGRRGDVLEQTARLHGSPEKLGPDGGSIVPLVMDVTSKDSIKAAVEKISQTETHVNLLVNNAGISGGKTEAKPADGPEAYSEGMFSESIEDGWQKSYQTNCTAVYFVTAAFVPLLARAAANTDGKVGSVINISSGMAVLKMTLGGGYAYSASKAAVNTVTRQQAFELQHENVNIRVNGISPGFFASELTTGPSGEDNVSTWDPEKFSQMTARIGAPKTKRIGTAQEMGSVVLTLATNEYITGVIITVDGGAILQLPSVM